MSGLPILTLLTLLPLAGAAIALVSGKHARMVALITTLSSLALALVVWSELPANGSIGLVERAAWAPSLGIEYHLGVDGLGALMVLLSASSSGFTGTSVQPSAMLPSVSPMIIISP